MNETRTMNILPFSRIVGQEDLKLALELAYISDQIGGVLISGQRGTGKSTAVRAFANMVYGGLPVTLPINVTEDRVIGGWKIDELMAGQAVPQPGLLEQANGKLLYVDEINLLDDHIVNIILDVTATGVLVIQREGKDEVKSVKFTLVGTMNPEEGDLRPQLTDRFGLNVNVLAELNIELRRQILRTVLNFDEALHFKGETLHEFLLEGYKKDSEIKILLDKAREKFFKVDVPEPVVAKCVQLAERFDAVGHRADYVLALAARALAALKQREQATIEDLSSVAKMALIHRRIEQNIWTEEDNKLLQTTLVSN